jgi:hypothetical protein
MFILTAKSTAGRLKRYVHRRMAGVQHVCQQKTEHGRIMKCFKEMGVSLFCYNKLATSNYLCRHIVGSSRR